MQEIARAVGIGQGTLYRRFAHKGLLCVALVDESARHFNTQVAAVLADERWPALAQLDSFLAALVAHMEEIAARRGAISDASCGERRDSVYEPPFYARLRGAVVTLLERAVVAGEAASLDLPLATDMVLAPLRIDLYVHHRHSRGHTPEQTLMAVRRVILVGLHARPADEGG